ncbi:MAG: hypothetical protein D6744_16700, partial [Planctomycetota bacterium]
MMISARNTGFLAVVLFAVAALPASAWAQGDDCLSATPIEGEGVFPFDLTTAETDPPLTLDCGVIAYDVWFRWTASADGAMRVATCGGGDVDSVLAVYDTNSCPPGQTDVLACDDDACNRQSQVVFDATAGTEYLIRVGAFPFTAPGSGVLTISAVAPLPEDKCVTAPVIALNTPIVVDAAGASADPNEALPGVCGAGKRLSAVVWYQYVATDPDVEIRVSGVPEADTIVAVHAGACDGPIGQRCDDDSFGVQQRTCFNQVVGETYYVQLAVEKRDAGDLILEVVSPCPDLGDPPCAEPAAHCVGANVDRRDDAYASDRLEFLAADEFRPAVSGELTSVCWWGGYSDGVYDCQPAAGDDFVVSYYADAGGAPGALIASYSQFDGTLTIDAAVPSRHALSGAVVEYEYLATHAPLPVSSDACYWVSVSNLSAPCAWYWSSGGFGGVYAFQDATPDGDFSDAEQIRNNFAFCLSVQLERDPNLSCIPDPPPQRPCAQPASHCQLDKCGSSVLSDGVTAVVADDFAVASDGSVSALCWWGAHYDGFVADDAHPDQFELRYYADAGGVPGALVGGPFLQSDGGLLVEATPTGESPDGFTPRIAYTATHAPVAVQAGQRYWIELRNLAGSAWQWEYVLRDSANGVAVRAAPDASFTPADRIADDLAFCLDVELAPPPVTDLMPVNDRCETAIELQSNDRVVFDNTLADTDPDFPPYTCFRERPPVGQVWYKFVATHDSILISTTSGVSGDSVIGLATGECGALLRRGCADDSGGNRMTQLCKDGLVIGQTYWIAVGSYAEGGRGEFELTLTSPCPPDTPPANDLCSGAIPVDVPSVTPGTTNYAKPDYDQGDCGDVLITSPGVWYQVVGTGADFTAAALPLHELLPLRLTVYELGPDCNDVTCVTPTAATTGALEDAVTWTTTPGATYAILVHGRAGAMGDFELRLCSSDAGDCNNNGVADGCEAAFG